MQRYIDPIDRLRQSNQRFLILLCLILGLLVFVPILQRFTAVRIFIDIFITAIFISMVYTFSYRKAHVVAGVFLAVVMLATLWLQYFDPNKWILPVGMIAGVIFFAMVISVIIGLIIKSEEVCREIIYAAILVYLLAALMWAFIYTFLELVDPASFNIELSRSTGYLPVFQYYSFVTITTLGYGDITPITDVAKAFSVLEAVIGQLYLVVAVAWLVGMHVSAKSR
jgi:hypothetical protein